MKSEREKSIENILTVKSLINLHSELIIRQKQLTNFERENVTRIKDLFLEKIIEIESLVLKDESLKKFFVFIPNKMQKIFNKFCEFDNLFGKLIIFNHLPEQNFIKKSM